MHRETPLRFVMVEPPVELLANHQKGSDFYLSGVGKAALDAVRPDPTGDGDWRR